MEVLCLSAITGRCLAMVSPVILLRVLFGEGLARRRVEKNPVFFWQPKADLGAGHQRRTIGQSA